MRYTQTNTCIKNFIFIFINIFKTNRTFIIHQVFSNNIFLILLVKLVNHQHDSDINWVEKTGCSCGLICILNKENKYQYCDPDMFNKTRDKTNHNFLFYSYFMIHRIFPLHSPLISNVLSCSLSNINVYTSLIRCLCLCKSSLSSSSS